MFKSRKEKINPYLPSSGSGYFNAETMISSSAMMATEVMHGYVFRGHESIPIKLAEKRIEYWRKKHPEDFEVLAKLEKKAYPEGLKEKKEELTEDQIRLHSINSLSFSSSSSSFISSSSSVITGSPGTTGYVRVDLMEI